MKDVELMKQKHPTNSNLLDMKEYLSELMSRSDVNSPSSGAELLKLKIYNTLNDPGIYLYKLFSWISGLIPY